jgi:two-component system chemotaxis sensor kinase CheA
MDVKNLSVTSNNGILGSVVVKGKACDLIDMSHYFARAYDDWMEKKAFEITPTAAGDEEAVAAPEGNVQKSLLLVDDSPFFRKFMKPILVAAGYKVATAEDAFEAEAMLKDGIAVDAVITDIDMPGKSGIEFVEGCKADPAFADMPFIALTSYDSEKLAEQTEGVGFTGFVSKADRDRLVSEINRLLAKEAV